jgi:hypothetical protein
VCGSLPALRLPSAVHADTKRRSVDASVLQNRQLQRIWLPPFVGLRDDDDDCDDDGDGPPPASSSSALVAQTHGSDGAHTSGLTPLMSSLSHAGAEASPHSRAADVVVVALQDVDRVACVCVRGLQTRRLGSLFGGMVATFLD